MTTKKEVHVDLKGREWPLKNLDRAERRLLTKLQTRVDACRNSPGEPAQKWCDFDNFWLPLVIAYYTPSGLTRKAMIQMPLYQIAQDLSGRLAVELGLARKPDYRSNLSDIIQSHFKTRREFCEATGLSEDMLSHVLSGRKDLSMESLAKALDRIGYTIRFVSIQDANTNKSA